MKDLNRLLEEPGADALEVNLLRLARAEGPNAESRRRILAGLGVGVAAGTLSASSDAAQASPASSAARSAAVKWGVASVVAVGASVIAFLSLQPKAPSAVMAPRVSSAAAQLAAAPAAASASSDLVPVTKLEDLPTLPDGAGADAPKSGSAPSLADEVLAIKSAKGALASGNAADALRQLDAYRSHFPRGRLAQEATVVRIEALLSSGNQAVAGAIADRFLSAHPDSPYSARVRTLLGR
jgi:hypothetical protein